MIRTLVDAGSEAAVGRQHIEIAAGEGLTHADAAPGVNGDAVAVGGGDAGRGGVGVVDALPLQLADIAIDRMVLPLPGWPVRKMLAPVLCRASASSWVMRSATLS